MKLLAVAVIEVSSLSLILLILATIEATVTFPSLSATAYKAVSTP
jgi:hypothetical protein